MKVGDFTSTSSVVMEIRGADGRLLDTDCDISPPGRQGRSLPSIDACESPPSASGDAPASAAARQVEKTHRSVRAGVIHGGSRDAADRRSIRRIPERTSGRMASSSRRERNEGTTAPTEAPPGIEPPALAGSHELQKPPQKRFVEAPPCRWPGQ